MSGRFSSKHASSSREAPMKVLFLDIDGVLNSADFFSTTKDGLDSKDWVDMLDPIAVGRLTRLLQRTGAKVVISSSWRCALSYRRIEELLRKRGFVGEVVGQTPDPANGATRGIEIGLWLQMNRHVRAFAIVDDCPDFAGMEDRYVQTFWGQGLQDEHVDRLVALLGTG